jgi:hypothetical protein
MINNSLSQWQEARFRKSSHSGANGGDCVEIAYTEELFGVRDSKNVSGPMLAVTEACGHALLSAVQNGRFNPR